MKKLQKMFVRMSHWQCKPECWAEAEALFDDGALPILEKASGIMGAHLLGEPGTGQRVAHTVWTDRAAHDAFAASADMERITRMFAHMYVDGQRPQAFAYPALRGKVFGVG